jgi:hypothetical protein
LLENAYVGALDRDGKERECPILLALFDKFRSSVPIVGRRTIGNQENPWPIVADGIRLVSILTLPEQVKPVSIASRAGCRRSLSVASDKSDREFESHLVWQRGQSYHRNFNALHCEGVSGEFILKCLNALVELCDWATAHRMRRIKE